MFTGLVAEVGTVAALARDAAGAELTVIAELAGQLAAGDSVAVDGACLTVTQVAGDRFQVQAMAETLRRTTIGELAPGDPVNLEPALAVGARLGGHIVQGHVDGVGRIVKSGEEGFARLLEIAPPPELMRYLVEKGSVAVAGVSLTIAALGEQSFTVSLIPETRQRTTLGRLSVGSPVNLEVDVIAKHVERLVREYVHNFVDAAGRSHTSRSVRRQ